MTAAFFPGTPVATKDRNVAFGVAEEVRYSKRGVGCKVLVRITDPDDLLVGKRVWYTIGAVVPAQ